MKYPSVSLILNNNCNSLHPGPEADRRRPQPRLTLRSQTHAASFCLVWFYFAVAEVVLFRFLQNVPHGKTCTSGTICSGHDATRQQLLCWRVSLCHPAHMTATSCRLGPLLCPRPLYPQPPAALSCWLPPWSSRSGFGSQGSASGSQCRDVFSPRTTSFGRQLSHVHFCG